MKLLAGHVFRDHVLLGGLLALFLLPLLGAGGSLMFWLATVLVDLDHYLHFLFCIRFKSFSPRLMLQFHEEVFRRRGRPEFFALEIFHTVEFLFLAGIVSFLIFPALRPLFWGMVFHLAIDLVHLTRFGIFSKRTHSVVEYFWRRKKMHSEGKDPHSVFVEAAEAMGLSAPETR